MQQQNVPASKPATQPDEFMETSYMASGQNVKLTFGAVRKYLVRGNATVTDSELVQFISLCKYNQLNPFLNEAYLVKFGGQTESAQMIVSKEALMKRAEACPEYDGMRAGLIIQRGQNIVDVEGSFLLATDTLLGGWAEVWRRDKKYPYVSRVSLSEYDKKQSTWNGKKSTMIRKTAIVQAMREAFPAQIGAMYTAEEQDVRDVQYEEVADRVDEEIARNANAGKPVSFDDGANGKSDDNTGVSVDKETGEIKGPAASAPTGNGNQTRPPAGSQTAQAGNVNGGQVKMPGF
jgi:phage recombination protein Bet